MTSPSVADLLKNVQGLNETEFEDFFKKLSTIREKGKAGKLSEQELTILQEIEMLVPKEKQLRFDFLIAKRDAHTISKKEYKELLNITDEIEAYDAKRFQLIGKLAKIRGIDLPKAVELFDIRPVAHG